MAADGLIRVQSSRGPADTMERLVAELDHDGNSECRHAGGCREQLGGF